MMLTILAATSLAFALIPASIFLRNFPQFQRLKKSNDELSLPAISVLIPARNEETSIGPCVESVLANRNVELEVVVLDDQSDDDTARMVSELSERDPRVRLASATTLPADWCGKQFACSQLATLAKHDIFVFLDADVRLTDDALQRMSQRFHSTSVDTAKVDLLSGFPRQDTGTLAERMLIPLIHFVLLGFLSLRSMRKSRHPAFGAGCGQLFMTHRDAYEKSGGHASIRKSLHDGLKLPRAYRRQDLATDLFDASDIATCRMYRNTKEVWYGLKKNATEGVASGGLIVPVTAMLLCGQVLPFALLVLGLSERWQAVAGQTSNNQLGNLAWGMVLAAMLLAWLPRFAAAFRYRQSWLGALLHPLAILSFLTIQWSAFIGSYSRKPIAWKGRPYGGSRYEVRGTRYEEEDPSS